MYVALTRALMSAIGPSRHLPRATIRLPSVEADMGLIYE